MKIQLHLVLISVTLLTFSCAENKVDNKEKLIDKEIERKDVIEMSKKSVKENAKKEIPKHYEHKYVTKRSGLNYMDSPNGNVLGELPLNTYLKILTNTNISEQIEDGDKKINGEWVGVEINSDTVYVFNGYLSNNYITSDLKLYNVSPFYKERDGRTRNAFLNVSETYFEDAYNGISDSYRNSIFTESDLQNDTIRLSSSQRKKFLEYSSISEFDKAFVYLLPSGEIQTYAIKDLQVIACINPYGAGDYGNIESDYMLGFDLNKSISNWDDNIAYIGKENPFLKGQLKPIIWTEIENSQFPIVQDLETLNNNLSSYIFSTDKFNYFLQKASERAGSFHIVIIDKETKLEVLNKYYYDSEGTYLTGLNIAGIDNEGRHQSQWTGKLFKNKAIVVFDFLGYSFGCPRITILDKKEPEIQILCDNRH